MNKEWESPRTNLSRPRLTLEMSVALERHIKAEEFSAVLKGMKSHKAPGPERLTHIFYAKLLSRLFGPFIAAYIALLQRKVFPKDFPKATIAMISKEGKDLACCSSYRPILLLNVDLKIVNKILANHLAPLLTNLIQPDQVGFIAAREAKDNIRRALNQNSLYWY